MGCDKGDAVVLKKKCVHLKHKRDTVAAATTTEFIIYVLCIRHYSAVSQTLTPFGYYYYVFFPALYKLLYTHRHTIIDAQTQLSEYYVSFFSLLIIIIMYTMGWCRWREFKFRYIVMHNNCMYMCILSY